MLIVFVPVNNSSQKGLNKMLSIITVDASFCIFLFLSLLNTSIFLKQHAIINVFLLQSILHSYFNWVKPELHTVIENQPDVFLKLQTLRAQIYFS